MCQDVPGIDLTETLDFIILFKCQPSTCFKMESPTMRVFFLGTCIDFEFFEGSLCGVVSLSLNFLLLLLFAIACKLSSRVYKPEGLDLFFVKSIVESYIISTRVLYGSLVLDELCVDKADGRYLFFVIVFIIWVLFKFSFLRYISSSFKDSVTTEYFGIAFSTFKPSISFSITYSSSLMRDLNSFSSAVNFSIRLSFRSCLLWLEFSLECEVGVTDVTTEWIIGVVLLEVENCEIKANFDQVGCHQC